MTEATRSKAPNEGGAADGPDPPKRIRRSPRPRQIDRGATGIRILLTILFAVIARAIEVVLTVLVLFELGFTLVTQHPPSRKTRDFANQVSTYLYRVTRYLTYNEAEPPFPFTDFPEPLEAPTDDYDEGVAAEPAPETIG